jgi:acyl carrier protein
MSEQDILIQIETILADIASSKGLPAPKISGDTQLLGGGIAIDSLDLAGLVRELEDVTGHDPFKKGFVNFRTAGELASLYQR